MISHFLKLEWKQYFRAANWQKSVFLNILLVFFGILFAGYFLLAGIFAFKVIKKIFPEEDPLVLVNSFLLFAIVGDLIFRYLMQKLPVMNIKPLLTLNIPRNKIVHFILIKSSFSFFNMMSLFFYIPFSLVLIKEGYDIAGVLGWLATMILLIQSANFLNFLINKNNIALGGLITLLIGGYLVQHFEIFNLAGFLGKGFDFIYQDPIFAIGFLGLLILLYVLNYKQLRNEVYLDALISEKVKKQTHHIKK